MNQYIKLDIETDLIYKDDEPTVLIITTSKQDLENLPEEKFIELGNIGLDVANKNNYLKDNISIDSLICTYDLVDNRILLLYGVVTDAPSRKPYNTRRIQ